MMQAPQQQGGGFLSNIAGGIMNGMTFGVGSAVANRAVDAVMGPRTTQVEHINAPAAAEAPAVASAPVSAPITSLPSMQPQSMMQQPDNRCSMELDYYQRCMQLNNNSLEACSQYSTQLQQCQRI